MTMRRLFIIRRDLRLSTGKLAAMVGHCCEAYWTNLLKCGAIEDQEYHTFPTLDEEGKSHWFKFRHHRIAEACKKAEEGCNQVHDSASELQAVNYRRAEDAAASRFHLPPRHNPSGRGICTH